MTAKEYNAKRRAEIEALRASDCLPFVDAGGDFEQQIMLWQARVGLTPDGKVGPATAAKLREVYAPPFTAADVVLRAWSAYQRAWVYRIGPGKGKPDPAKVPAGAPSIEADCTGYAWWATARHQPCHLDCDRFGPVIPAPVPGCVVWHNARPPAEYGHAGVVVAVHPDGDYDTLDCSSTNPKPRHGAIRHQVRAAKFWRGGGDGSDVRFRFPANARA